jgi:hypothetical protein
VPKLQQREALSIVIPMAIFFETSTAACLAQEVEQLLSLHEARGETGGSTSPTVVRRSTARTAPSGNDS